MDYDAEAESRSDRLAEVFGADPEAIMAYEAELREESEFWTAFSARWNELKDEGLLSHTTSRVEAETMYVLCRLIEPEVVVNTGVLYGSFGAHILAALAENGSGKLYSIDLPNDEEKPENGYLIPPLLRDRWDLRLGDTRELLEDVLTTHGPVDLFLHDALHTKENMRREYELVHAHLELGGVIASHDTFKNDEFQHFAQTHSYPQTRVVSTGIMWCHA